MLHAVRVKLSQQPIWLLLSSMVVATFIILFWGTTMPPENTLDDAYITYRYADNFRNGLGLVYNPGQWVFGTTTPLFTLLLGTLGFFFADIEILGHWLGVLSWVIATWAAAAIFWQEKRHYAAFLALFLMAFQPDMFNMLGMETTLVIALMLASAWAWLGGRPTLAAFLLAALIVTRADGALWALIIGLEMWRRNGRFPWRITLLTILLVAPWFLYAQWRYGTFLPNSVFAKTGQMNFMPHGEISFVISVLKAWHWMPPVALVAFGLLVLVGLWIIVRSAYKFWWIPAWILLYFVAYTALDVVGFPWYFVPPTIMIILVAAMGAGGLLGDDSPFTQIGRKRLASVVLAVTTLLVFMLPWFDWLSTVKTRVGYAEMYPSVGQWFNEHTPEDARVATAEIGIIGYLSQRPILDTMGLISPEMTSQQVGWVETLAYAVSQLWPDYAVVLDMHTWDQIIEQWWFFDYYQPVAKFDTITIYQLQNCPVTPYQVKSDTAYSIGFTLSGVDFSERQLQPGGVLDVWLHMEVHQSQTANYELTTYLIDAQTDERMAVTKVEPLYGLYRSSVWQPGDLLTLPTRLQTPNDLVPGVYRLGLFIYNPEDGKGLPTTTTPEGSYPEVELGWLRYGNPEVVSSNNLISQPIHAMWQQGIQLEEIALSTDIYKPGDALLIGLQWYVAQTPTRNLTVFVHLINEAGDILAQQDQLPFAGRFPTPSWQPDEQLYDQIQIQLPPDLPPGNYGLRIGLYDEDGRLPLLSGGEFIQYPASLTVE